MSFRIFFGNTMFQRFLTMQYFICVMGSKLNKTMESPVLQACDCSESVQSVELVNQQINIKTQFAIDVNNARDHQTTLDQMTDLTS